MNQNAIKALCEKLGIDPTQEAEREREAKYGWRRDDHCTHPNQEWCDCDWCRLGRERNAK